MQPTFRHYLARFPNRLLMVAVFLLAAIGDQLSLGAAENTAAPVAHCESSARPSVRLELDSTTAVLASQFLSGTQMQEVKFDAPVTGRFFCLESLSAQDGRAYAAIAELNLIDEDGEVMNRSGWKIAYADSEERERENDCAENALDGDPNTFWHTEWRSAAPGHPHHFVLDLGKPCTISGFQYLPRQGQGGVGGRIKDYRVYVGDNLIENAPQRPLPEKFYILSYFTGGGENGLQLAFSLNGYRWDPLNRGTPVIKPEVGGKLMRDPRIARGPDGTFHMVWTEAWYTNGIGYASSTDLVHWSEQQSLPVMASFPDARNCWAPDVFWDVANQQFLICWASTVTNQWSDTAVALDNRLYYTTTKDFKTFSETKLFYDPGTGVLNGVIWQDKNRFYLIFKDELLQRLRVASAENAAGPYSKPGPIIQNNDSPEGPVVYRLSGQTVVFFSTYVRSGAVRSSDMEHWEDISAGIVLPTGASQGSVLELPGTALKPFLDSGMLEPGTTPAASELGLGDWIWTTNLTDLQPCHFWHSFYIPDNTPVARAELRMTADNSYTVYLDGRQIGRGGDPFNVAEYDITLFMTPGRHILAVDAFNDAFDAGMMLGLQVKLANGKKIEVLSDPTWRIATGTGTSRNWLTQKQPDASWPAAKIVGYAGMSWWQHPNKIIQVPPLQPPVVHFWQQAWFLALLILVCLTVAVLWMRESLKLALHTRASSLLERERARIARDMHDDLGSGLTQLTLLGELVLRDVPRDGEMRTRVNDLCAKARALLRSMDEIVWTVSPRHDTLKDFVAFISGHAEEFLASTAIRCRQDIAEELPALELGLPQRRNLLLAIKESLRNAARHSGATEVKLTVVVVDHSLRVIIEDNGHGFAPSDTRVNRNGMVNMKQRLTDIGGTFILDTAPGKGCRIMFVLPLQPSIVGKT